jgi:hypothetical protein
MLQKAVFVAMFAVAVTAMLAPAATAGVPQMINYQGRLTDSAGDPLDTTVSMMFTIYDDSTGGNPIWTESHSAVDVDEGIFSVVMGATLPIDDSVFAGGQCWLEIEVEGEAITPLTKLTSVPYSHRVSTVDGASGGKVKGLLQITQDTLSRLIIDPTIIVGDPAAPAPGILQVLDISGMVCIELDGTSGIDGRAIIGPGHWGSGYLSFVAGSYNSASGDYSAIGGGSSNEAQELFSTVAGGDSNVVKAGANHGAICGGQFNMVHSSSYGTIAGGQRNHVSADWGAIGGGERDTVTGQWGTIGGGRLNVATGPYSTIAGGYNNDVNYDMSTVGGGQENKAVNYNATVSGGANNEAAGNSATVSGGLNNTVSANYSSISGGQSNTAEGRHATIGGGQDNRAGLQIGATRLGDYATVGGGANNEALGDYATVPGGQTNTASGFFSFAAGSKANASELCSFVWSDCCDYPSNLDFYSQGDFTFNVRAVGGVYIYSSCDLSTGVRLLPGATSWIPVVKSDSTLKQVTGEVNGREILDKLADLQISKWSYKSQDPSIQHIGPMAQDFYGQFGLGDNEKNLPIIDAVGIALAAIQELNRKTEEIDALKLQVQELQMLVEKLIAEKQ